MKRTILMVLAGLLAGTVAFAGEPWLAPGNLQARHDIQLLVDDGVIDIPLSQWPIATADLAQALAAAERKYGLFERAGRRRRRRPSVTRPTVGIHTVERPVCGAGPAAGDRADRKHGLFR